jgi:D-beta-D-heptose 7-phosphate kinase/D-beta-D-heptose 1-phosphate adenosyltransferase
LKQRLLGRTQSRHPQQILRIDREQPCPLAGNLADELVARVEGRLDHVDAILVSDYGKGVCSREVIRRVARAAGEQGIPVVVDPARSVDYERYLGCTAITPNRAEAGAAMGRALTAPDDGLTIVVTTLARSPSMKRPLRPIHSAALR